MKRLCFRMVLLMLVIAPGLVAAQGLGTGLVPPGLPPYGSAAGPAPAYTGLGATRDSLFTIYAGWLEHYSGLGYSGVWSDYAEQGDQPLAGIWLGADLSMMVSPDMMGTISFGWLFPTDRHISIDATTGGHWEYTTDTQWGVVDGNIAYNLLSWGEAVVGFRWDHFTSRWELLSDPDVDMYNFKLNAFLPYFGLQSRYSLPNTQLLGRVIGFPWAPGSMKYEWQDPVDAQGEVSTQGYEKGYFFEALFACTYQAFDNTSLGAFVTYNLLHFGATGEVIESPGPVSDSLDMSFHRKAWTLGASVSVEFDL